MSASMSHWKKNIRTFLMSQTLSLFGSSLVQYAIMWYITLETKSGIMMTISILCGFIPAFFMSPFGGVWADRYDRKKMIIFSDAGIAISTLVLAGFFMLGYKSYWMLFLVSAIRSFGGAIQAPAVNAFIPQIIPEDKLMRVNGLNGALQSTIMIISPAVSGVLLSMTSIENIFFIDVVTAAIAILILQFFLKVDKGAHEMSRRATDVMTELKDGILYIKNHYYVMSFFTVCAVFFVLIAPAAFLTPLQVTRSFGSDVWRLTTIEIAFSAGMILGSALLASWGGFQNRVKTMILSMIVMGICTILLGYVDLFTIYLATMGIFGIALPFFNTPSMVLLQEKVEDNYLGRVFGIMGMISSSTMPIAMLLFGPLADYISIEILLYVTGVLTVVLAVYVSRHKKLLEAGQPAAKLESVYESN